MTYPFTQKTILATSIIVVLAVAMEFAFRTFPDLIPYPYGTLKDDQTHYAEMVRALKDASYLSSQNPQIIVLGDSLTRGTALPVENDWPGLLRRERGVPLFNLAVGGTSTFEQKLLLEALVIPPSVKTVLLNIYHNDVV